MSDVGDRATPTSTRLLGLESVVWRLVHAAGLRTNTKIIVGCTMVGIVVMIAICAPVLAPYRPNEQDLAIALSEPSPEHLFGTDQFGRDVLSRVMYAARIDLQIALIGTFFSLALGVSLGLVSGYFGRAVDMVVGRLIDVVVAFPSIVLVITLIAFLGTGLGTLYLAIAITGWTAYARLVRGDVLSIRNLPYCEAARALGYSHARIILRHVLPNVISPAGVYWITDMVSTILLVTALSYLGLGTQPPTPEWGAMIAEGRPFLLEAWWISVFPGLAILFTGTGLALLGDGVVDQARPEVR